MDLHIRTADELRERPAGWTIEQHLRAIDTAIGEHSAALLEVAMVAEAESRANTPLELKAYDRHENQCTALRLLRTRIEGSPEANEVDYRQVVGAGSGWASNDGSELRSYDQIGRHTGGGLTYNQHDVRTSWVKDLISAFDGDQASRQRLDRNNREFATENRALAGNVAGAVGEFVPPAWLMSQLVRVARPARVFADQINGQPLNVKTNTIDIPRLTTGTATAQQTTENTAVQNTDAASDYITSKVVTIAGQQVVSVQLLDQSPVSMDQIILEDLAADLAVKVDQFALSSTGTGQVGLLNLSGINAVAYTDASPTTGELYPKIADAIQRISTTRYLPPEKIFMHPRRWAWLTAALDTAGRPLVVPIEQNPQNAQAAMGGLVAQGLVGSLQGLPVFTDPSIPTNLGGGTNQDPIIVSRTSDLYLWESAPMAMVDRFSLSSQLSVRIVLHRYVSVQHGRYPAATSVVNGTGTIAPTF